MDGAGLLISWNFGRYFNQGFTVLDGGGEDPGLLLWWSGWLEQLAS